MEKVLNLYKVNLSVKEPMGESFRVKDLPTVYVVADNQAKATVKAFDDCGKEYGELHNAYAHFLATTFDNDNLKLIL